MAGVVADVKHTSHRIDALRIGTNVCVFACDCRVKHRGGANLIPGGARLKLPC